MKGLSILISLPYKRILEYVSVITCSILFLGNGYYIFKYAKCGSLFTFGFTTIAAMVVADFLCGLVHWAADTWGTTDMPFFGPYFLRPFREHHVDPTTITRHDFVETNGYNFAVVIPFWTQMLRHFLTANADTICQHYHLLFYIYVTGFFIAFTNQIHKWAHTYSGLPLWVRLLQNAGIILPQRHHRHHHISPHETYYCITTGWLNYPLEKLQFWSGLEHVITRVTGSVPRSDDIRWIRKRY